MISMFQVEVDPADEEWSRLRLQLLGPDNPEFSILKPATAPAYPNVSNRKMLTALGFAVPFGLMYLMVAGYDRLRTIRPRPLNGVAESPSDSVWDELNQDAPAPTEESALIKARVHQWLNGSMPKRPTKSDNADRDGNSATAK